MKRKIDWFIICLGLVIALAWIFPGPGSEGGWMHARVLTKAGVALIFFLHGANLSFHAMRAGALRWPLHVAVQFCTFALFPLLGFAILWIGGGYLSGDFGIGIFFLCALPSTVSSSVAMTAIARGNIAGAIFNATLSSLIGVFITPFWIAFVMQSQGEALPLGGVIVDLLLWLVLPLVVGQLTRPVIGTFIHRHKKGIHVIDRGVILLIVYASFCDSVSSGVWSGQDWKLLAMVLVLSAILFFVVMAVMEIVCRALKFPVEDRITAIFCGSKKSLAAGVPMAQIIFAGHPGLSIILLPIIIYHAFQLTICAWLAQKWGAREDVD